MPSILLAGGSRSRRGAGVAPSRLGVRAARSIVLVVGVLSPALTACSTDRAPPGGDRTPEAAGRGYELDPQLVFWEELRRLCGQAFGGRLVEAVPPEPSFATERLVMHVRACDVAEVRIAFHVGADRSRTWVVTPTSVGIRLTHRHRHRDGTEDEVSRYGGETMGTGTDTSQDFPADRYTAELVPAAATNVWTLELHPDSIFAYALRREEGVRRFRVEFDLGEPVAAPPPPWGAER